MALQLLFNGEWLFFCDTDHRCLLLELKNINQKSIYDKHGSAKDLGTSAQKVDSLNSSFRTRKPRESSIDRKKGNLSVEQSKAPVEQYRVFLLWAPKSEQE